MNRNIYKMTVFVMFIIFVLLSFFGAWIKGALAGVWLCFFGAIYLMRTHAYNLPHVTTFSGISVNPNSPYKLRRHSYRVDFFLYWILLPGMFAVALLLSDEPSLFSVLVK
ncbi:hypothetical protein [Formosimonas limnophila]|uniref:hypothetical protein n=1 Tax=Formosimonas limnophila TaxID=1384487 RepID=UPI0016751676|nr:hypothetical protein [Formosimonas limnophila]